MSAPTQYPAVDPYPATKDESAPSTNGGPPPRSGAPPSSSAAATPPPVMGGPGSGFPARSGLAGMQPHSYASGPSAGMGAYGGSSGPSMGGMGGMGGMGSNAGSGIGGIGPGTGAGLRGGLPEEKNVAQMVQEHTNVYARKFQALLDRSTPHTTERWAVTFGLFLLFVLNVVIRQGWYIVCYALAIYILNLFLAFLQPRFDPSVAADLAADEVEEGAPGLPGAGGSGKPSGGIKGLMSGFRAQEDEEFRPFIRRLPEFKFWYSATKATAIALGCTITRATDVPVYWPILLMYFLVLFGLTMRRQIQHMIKYKYIPFDLGKKRGYGKK